MFFYFFTYLLGFEVCLLYDWSCLVEPITASSWGFLIAVVVITDVYGFVYCLLLCLSVVFFTFPISLFLLILDISHIHLPPLFIEGHPGNFNVYI